MYAASRQRASSRCSTPLARLAIILLAVLQFVAPTWHVCELGGSSCCEHPLSASQTLSSLAGSTQKCGRCKEHKGTASGSVVQGRDNCPFNGTCLARLLESMPGSVYALSLLLLLFITRRRAASTLETLLSLMALPQPPVRGPPFVVSFSS